MLLSRSLQMQAYFLYMGLTLVRGLCFFITKNSYCFCLLTVIPKALYQCLCSYFSPSPLFSSLSDVGSIQQSDDKVSWCLHLCYVCTCNPAVVEGQLRRGRYLWKLLRFLNLLCPVRVTLSPAVWKMKQNANTELK